MSELPKSGRVVLSHPLGEDHAAKVAESEDLPYMLSDIADPKSVYIMDLDLILQPIELEDLFPPKKLSWLR